MQRSWEAMQACRAPGVTYTLWGRWPPGRPGTGRWSHGMVGARRIQGACLIQAARVIVPPVRLRAGPRDTT